MEYLSTRFNIFDLERPEINPEYLGLDPETEELPDPLDLLDDEVTYVV